MSNVNTLISLERGAVLDHYIKLMSQLDDLHHGYSVNGAERAAAINSATSDLMDFRDQHDITIPELTAWRNRNVKKATSVSHAIQLLGRRSA